MTKVDDSDNYGGNIRALTSDGTYIYAAGITTQTVWKIDPSDMTKVDDSDNYGGSIYALTSDGTYIYAAGVTTVWKIGLSCPVKTGDYAMRCDTSAAMAFATGSGNPNRVKVSIYIVSAPDGTTIIIGDNTANTANVRLTSTRYLELYNADTKKGNTGSTQLALNTWYDIDVSLDPDSTNDPCKVYLDQSQQISADTNGCTTITENVGVGTAVTADIYFDDIIFCTTASTADLGDIRVLRASPNDAGQYAEYDSVSGYGNVDECPASDTDYVEDNGSDLARECYNLQNATTIGIGGSDTIEAVSVWIRGERDGGSATDHKILVRDDGTDEASAGFGFTTSYSWFGKYYAVMPKDSAAWTQTRFDGFQVGCQHLGGQDQRVSCVMVMVAYSPYIIPEVALSAEKTTTDTGNTVLYPGETDQWMGTFGFVHNKATGDTITGVNITLDGSAVPADIDTISLYKDSDSTYTSGSETLFGSSTCSNVKTSITGSMSVSTTMTYLHVVFNITSGATIDNTEGAEIAANTDVTFSGDSTLTDAPKTLGTGTITLPLSSAIEIRSQNYTSPVSTITFPEDAPGVTVSLPYNNVDGSGNPQAFGTPQGTPVVTLYNSGSVTYTIWYNITTFTEGIVASENYLINDKGDACASADAITDAVTFDADTNTTTTIAAGAGNEKDLYLKITLSEVAAKSGTSTLTILGETA